MTKIVLALMTILGCSSLDWANFQESGTGGANQTSSSGSTQKDVAKPKKPGSGGVDTLTIIGTWKLDEAKTKLAPEAPKNTTVVYEAAGDNIKAAVDGTDSDGKPTHSEWTGKFDGKDYPVTGDPTSDTRAYKKVDDHTFQLVVKKGGKVTVTGRIVVSADGKTRTVTLSGTDPDGKKFNIISVYDRQ